MAFLLFFWMCLPSTHSFTPSKFGIWKVFRRYISRPSFIYVSFVVPEFSNLKCFRTSRKYLFWLLLGNFLEVTPLNVFKFVLNLSTDAVESNASEIWQFLFCFKEMVKIGWKKDFLALFQRFFNYSLIRPMSYARVFCQM